MNLAQFLEKHGSAVRQHSERLFLEEFLYPLIGEQGLKYVYPQRPFIDSTGRRCLIDFSIEKDGKCLAVEIDGEGYHSPASITSDEFDDQLMRQNEILAAGWHLVRFSYNQLLSDRWRPLVRQMLRDRILDLFPELIDDASVRMKPNPLQQRALADLEFYRKEKAWNSGIVVLPTGTGKTYLSAFDARRFNGRTLYVVHRLDILRQSLEAFKRVWPEATTGLLTGEERKDLDAQVIFASKDTLCRDDVLFQFSPNEFDYIIIDEVHHGQAPTYRKIINYFRPKFMLGMTATPDRQDRKDIFELFDYRKIHETTLQEAIEQGYLVPYTYYGLYDDIDYSKIRHDGRRYNVQDLERKLIIPERNAAILREYLDKGHGDKAIGFCVSIAHAERMAEYFRSHGLKAEAIHSQTEDREAKIRAFRDNQIHVVFTVDLFNEGIDIPNVRTLMFLRPTESKTIFLQQLGRGLRLYPGKDRVVVLDFIGNYKRANHVRRYLAKDVKRVRHDARGDKVEIVYPLGCEVHFDVRVEEIIRQQDEAEMQVTEEELRDAYYEVAEKIQRKPTQDDINQHGRYRTGQYIRVFGSWTRFLRAIGEYTEASYHYPQGTHLGHLLYILRVLARNDRRGTLLDDKYIRVRGNFDDGPIGNRQRQTKYKLQALMALGAIADDRELGPDTTYELKLTPRGEELVSLLRPVLDSADLTFVDDASWRMTRDEAYFNKLIADFIRQDVGVWKRIADVFLDLDSVRQMFFYLYGVERQKEVSKETIYHRFFKAPFVRRYCDRHGIEEPTLEVSRRRCPFLLNVLEALGFIEKSARVVKLITFPIHRATMSLTPEDTRDTAEQRARAVAKAWPDKGYLLDGHELSILREQFGADFLTANYFLSDAVVLL